MLAGALSAIPAASLAKSHSSGIFVATDGFASLAGFTFLAAALERIAQFVLAPWWGKVSTQEVSKNVQDVDLTALKRPGAADLPRRVGVADAARLSAKLHTAASATDSSSDTKKAALDADSVYVAATKLRPTIMLPMAAGATVICSFLHLYLLHSLAKSGFSTKEWSYIADGVLTGFAIAGGAQPFHNLVTSLASSATKSATG